MGSRAGMEKCWANPHRSMGYRRGSRNAARQSSPAGTNGRSGQKQSAYERPLRAGRACCPGGPRAWRALGPGVRGLAHVTFDIASDFGWGDMSDQFDLIVIGGGSGGLAAAKRAAEYGARVVLIESG